jgi:nucleotide-binding universal stress UspA family protein
MRKIIVGVDLSPQSEIAVGHAVDVARHTGAEVVLVMADCVPDYPTPDKVRPELESEWARTLEQRLASDRRGLGEMRERWSGQGVTISHVVADGFADDLIPRVAQDVGADLIAVGTHGRTGIMRAFLGSVAERTTRLASQSVLVARGDAPRGGYRRVVIGTDFSPLSDTAIDRALEVTGPGARLDLVHCWQIPLIAGADGVMPYVPYDEMRADLEKSLTEATRTQAARAKVELTPHLVERPPAFGLVDFAKERDADLIVVGSHGRRGIRRFLLGSVAEVTVRHAGCSVLVAR